MKPLCLEENGGNGQHAGSVLHLINIGKIYFKINMLIKKRENGSQSVKIVLSFNQSIKRRKTVYIFLLRAF